ncbi:MAG: SurA N-terminal domain-containing protein [Candidatus Paceibacterota bacterium]
MTDEQDKNASEVSRAVVGGASNKVLVGGIVVVVIIVVIAMAAWLLDIDTPMNGIDNSAAVATVNGEEITEQEYELQLENMRQLYESQGRELEEKDRSQLLDSLVDRELILQYAQETNVTVSESEVDEQFNEFREQFAEEEQFDAFLEDRSLTQAQIREDIKTQIIVQEVLEAQWKAANRGVVTDEEVEARYDELVSASGDGEAPPLEDVASQIRAQMVQEQRAEVYSAFIAELHENAEVEILI